MHSKHPERMSSAQEILRNGADAIDARAAQRDMPDGERSMARAVAAFNGLVGGDRRLTETEGWLFMVCLKAARATAGALNPDDYVDGAAYFALAGECAEREGLKQPDEEPGRGDIFRAWDCLAGDARKGPLTSKPVVSVLLGDGTVLDTSKDGGASVDWGPTGTVGGKDVIGYRLQGDP